MIIKRDYYLNKLIEAKHDKLIKVVTGIRRVGKSFLLDPLFTDYLKEEGVKEDHIIKIELDKPKNKKYLDLQVLNEYIEEQIKDDDMYYVILDEIQLVKDFEYLLNGLLYEKNIDVYVTGSNSKFLSTDIITEFRGRSEEIRVYPLSFAEFMSVSEKNIFEGFNEYMTYGGLPVIATTMQTIERKKNYLKEQYNNVYINDVLERNDIRNEKVILENILEVLSSSIGSLTNPNKLSNTFKSNMNIDINSKTIMNYIKYFSEAFIIEEVKRYDVKGKKYINSPFKIYFTDIGIRNAIINFRQQEPTHILENIIYLELKRRGYNVDVGLIEDRTTKNGDGLYKQLEVDFIATRGSQKYYIQSAYHISDKEKREQEARSLLKIDDSFKKIIITMDYLPSWVDDNGIITINIYDFLLNDDFNSILNEIY